MPEESLIEKLLRGDRVVLSRLITLAESSREEDQLSIQKILEQILPHIGNSIRIGVTGSPGVGKSTFIESFGTYITSTLDKKVAVLSVDPSSPTTKGSILGDKTRMEKLSRDNKAFIRPSASRSFLGGVAHATRESILLCEAAGFEVIIVETVGVGQSEFSIKDMTDCFLLLMLAGSGDELQGIKKGIMEMADIIAITKADGENAKAASKAQTEFQHALHLLHSDTQPWTPSVLSTSAIENLGIDNCWIQIQKFISLQKDNGAFDLIRNKQLANWLDDQLVYQIKKQTIEGKGYSVRQKQAVEKVQRNEWTVFKAVDYILNKN